MTLMERMARLGRADAEREHRATRGSHAEPQTSEFCPLCARRPTWARAIRAKELTR